jgi:mannose-6-phosphate isomerase-like protein (cupin superfamily)
MRIRRVVTGQTVDGRSVFVSDEHLEPTTLRLLPGAEFHPVWGSDQPVALPTDGSQPGAPQFFPPSAGFRFMCFIVPPAGVTAPSDLDLQAALAEMEEKLPGLIGAMEPNNPGMHTTDTVDFDLVVAGEVFLELDDGAEVRLEPGDCVVQNGTRHRWRNRSTQPCVIAVALLGMSRS